MVLHSWEFCSNLSTFIPQMNKHYTSSLIVLLSMEKLPIFKNCKFSKNFHNNLWLWILCCFGPHIWLKFGFPTIEKHFDITNFFKVELFLQAFAMSSSGSFHRDDIQSILRQVLAWPSGTLLKRYELQWTVVMPVWCQWLSYCHLALYYQFDSHFKLWN